MSVFYRATYYWFIIILMFAMAISIWCWRCYKQGQRNEAEILARNHQLFQLQQQEPARPSNYQLNAPPAYDDVINKPDDYPVYNASLSTGTTHPSHLEHSYLHNNSQNLPSYEEAVNSIELEMASGATTSHPQDESTTSE